VERLLAHRLRVWVVFERWVTPEEADRDLIKMALRN
jgi:hypothetical protein